jgi:hypothetical protein
MLTPHDVPLKNSGDPLITAEQQNALTVAARKDFDIRRGMTNRADRFAAKDVLSDMRWEFVQAQTVIPSYSVFTLKYGTSFSSAFPVALSKKVVQGESYNIIATNDVYAQSSGNYFWAALIGFEEPKLVKYDPADGVPDVDDVVGPKPGTWVVSKKENGLVAVSAADTTNERVWVIRNASDTAKDIQMFEFTEILHPGRVANARKLIWDPTGPWYELDPADTKEYKLFDPEEQNFFLPTERVHAFKKELRDYMSVLHSEYEIIGEHGLHRRTLTNADIDCGDSGQAIVQQKSGTKIHPPPFTPVCDLESAADANIEACNVRGPRRKLLLAEMITVSYDHGRQAWFFEQEDRPSIAEATLSDDLCPNTQTINVQDVRFLDWTNDGCSYSVGSPYDTPTEVTNSKKLASVKYNKVFIVRKEGGEGADEWHIWEADHIAKDLLTQVDEQGSCQIQFWKREFSVMTCKETDLSAAILGQGITAVTGVSISDCGLTIHTADVCVLKVVGTDSDPLNFTPFTAITKISVEEGSPGSDECAITLEGTSFCALPGGTPGDIGSIPISYDDVATGVVPRDNCVDLVIKSLPHIGCGDLTAGTNEPIFCVVDCVEEEEYPPETVVTSGTVTVPNKTTQPYDPTSVVDDDDIIIKLPLGEVEGASVYIVNDTMSENRITVDGNGYNVQNFVNNSTAATTVVWGARLSIRFQFRAITGSPTTYEWRIV